MFEVDKIYTNDTIISLIDLHTGIGVRTGTAYRAMATPETFFSWLTT
jgi:hypothetical protein